MSVAFIRNLAAIHLDGAVQSALDAIVRWDPEGSSLADLRTMDQNLDAIGIKVAEAQVKLDEETRQADVARGSYNQRVAAIGVMKAGLAAETDPAARADKEAKVRAFAVETKRYEDAAKKEIADQERATAILARYRQAQETAATALKGKREQMERSRQDLELARQRKADAEQAARDASEAAGLAPASRGVDIALKAINEATARANAEADAITRKADLLRPTKESDDPFVAEAMAKAAGKKPEQSLDELMADLKPL